jgi:hypothetical protein
MGEFDWYRRIVFRSTPVRRAISCWLAPFANSVSMVIRKCDFKTFNSWLPRQKGKQRKRPAAQQNRHLPAQVSGGFSGGHNWGSLGGRRGLMRQHTVFGPPDCSVEGESPGHAEYSNTHRKCNCDTLAQTVPVHY